MVKKKVLFIQGVPRFGGAQVSLCYLAKSNAIDSLVVTSKEGKFSELCKRNGVKVYIVPLPMWRKLKSWFRIPIALIKLVSIIVNENIDIVYANTLWDVPYSVVLSLLTNKYSVGHFRNTFSEDKIGKYLVKFLHKTIAVSFEVAKTLWKYDIRCKVVYNGAPVPDCENRGSNDCFLISLIGRVDSTKGQDIAIKSMGILRKKISRIKLVIAGEESYLERGLLKRLIYMVNNLGLRDRVSFLGYVDKVYELLCRTDVSLVPSKQSSNEGFGRVIIESFACGVPVIASRVGGILTVMRDGKVGFVVLPDEFGFSECILKYTLYPVVRRRHSTNAKVVFSRYYKLDRVVNNLISELYGY